MKLLEKLIGMSVSIAFIAIGQFPLHSCTRSNKHMLNVNERVILANNKVITYQVLTEKEFIHLTGGGYYEMLSNYLSKSILVYKTNSGLLYFNDEGRCGVFNNISDLNSYVALKSEKHGSTQILFQKNRYGEHFPLHIDALKKELLDTLHIDGDRQPLKYYWKLIIR